MDLMPFDEINKFEAALPQHFNEAGRIKSKEDLEDIIDEMLDIFLLSYANGVAATNLSLSSDYAPTYEEVMKTVDAEVVGKTWRDRMQEHFDNGGTVDDVVRIVETESHRDANAGAYETAKESGATEKIWHTMLDDRVRDSHSWLEGVSAPLDGEFYNYLGQSTKYPGQWGIAEEDINCRCWLTYK